MYLSKGIRKFKLLFLRLNILGVCLTPGLWFGSIQAANPNTGDIFYIPMGSVPIKFDGQWTEAEWKQGNYFTFGYEGSPEVELYAFWLNTKTEATLNLAIHIDDITVLPDQDQFYLCFDPLNEGTQLYWFKITRANNSALYVQSRTDTWTYVKSHHSYMQHRIYSHVNYWEAEIKIPLRFLENNNLPFGMYLRVFDYFKMIKNGNRSTNYFEYNWPTSGKASSIPPRAVLPIRDWANGYLIYDTVPTRPDLFFSHREQAIYMQNPNASIEIIPGYKNNILTKIANHYLNATSEIQHAALHLQWSEFGNTRFYEIVIDSDFSLLPNIFTERLNSWITDPELNGVVTLRAEIQTASDAITCNNGVRRDLQFFRISPGERAMVVATVTNPDESRETSVSPAVSREWLFFLIDRTRLNSPIADSLWEVSFEPPPGDTLFALEKDRFCLAFQPGESKKFTLEVLVPDGARADQLNADWTPKLGRTLFSKKISSADRTGASAGGLLPESQLRIQVAKEQNHFLIDQTIQSRYQVLGYFGVELEIAPKKLLALRASPEGAFRIELVILHHKVVLGWEILLIPILLLAGLVYVCNRRLSDKRRRRRLARSKKVGSF
ncbi:hypothetical protein L0128_00940 [candidate division KSB1 bacterium]|nr:hypothetical protein [candidate division KSB1 bacterium]